MKALALILTVAVAVLVNIPKCNNETITDLGPDTSYIANFSNFKSIDAKGIASINYTQGKEFHLKVYGQKLCVDNLVLSVQNGTLYISQKKSINANGWQRLNIDITAPDIESLAIDGVGSFNCDGNFSVDHNIKIISEGVGNVTFNDVVCNDLEIRSEGVGSANIHNLAANDVDIICSGVGGVTVNTNCHYVNVNCSGVGGVTVSGSADNYSVSKSGVGGVNVNGLEKK